MTPEEAATVTLGTKVLCFGRRFTVTAIKTTGGYAPFFCLHADKGRNREWTSYLLCNDPIPPKEDPMPPPEFLCFICRESIRDDDPQKFCTTCDHWMHVDCLHRHATVEPDGEGDWKHVA